MCNIHAVHSVNWIIFKEFIAQTSEGLHTTMERVKVEVLPVNLLQMTDKTCMSLLVFMDLVDIQVPTTSTCMLETFPI